MSINLLAGDCRDVLPTLAAASVQCVVTSPPYYGLRDYGTALWDGGEANCQHTFARQDTRQMLGSNGTLGKNCTSWTHRDATPPRQCSCGATRIDRQIGLEATPDEYLATMVAVFREVRRVLRPDGTVWCNMGDSYSGSTTNTNSGFNERWGNAPGARKQEDGRPVGSRPGKPKDLLMMPARLALALQADGWWLRSDIIWHKPNPMPESVTDRPTSAHEHVFLLTKRSRYHYDADAVREPHDAPSIGNRMDHFSRREQPTGRSDGSARSAFTLHGGGREYNPAGRSCRNVWTIATAPYSDAHFATFPPSLAERCIRAGTSERGACSQCGAPWGRMTSKELVPTRKASHTFIVDARDVGADRNDQGANRQKDGHKPGWINDVTTTGWSPSCRCGTTETRPCVVLDPFAGAGTTLLVADRLQRDAIGIELNPDYTRLAMKRCQDDAPLFTSFPPAKTDPQDERMRDLFREAAD